jgi:tRNA A-37 threonylcarbamoyl transferase component Bud32
MSSAGDVIGKLEGPERLIGTRVLDFELTAIIGSGGMSVVYRGRHRVTNQEVAIKILPPELAVHDELKARFVEEARVLARLEHPNIVNLNNFTEAGGRLCLVMQFVEGVTFEQKIHEHKQVPVAEAVKIAIEVCKALEYAHGQGVVHRDIKPSNVLVRTDGAVKVTDFGIAKMLGQTRLTSTGQTMGTVRYMSPEQVRGKVADARSDIYSLGVTLYEALAGGTPFDGENHFDIMQQHLKNRPPPLVRKNPAVPPSVEKVVLTALEKNAQDRYAEAREMRVALERVLPDVSSAPALGAGYVRRRRNRLAPTLGVVVLLVAGIGGTVLVARTVARHDRAASQGAKPALAPEAARPKEVLWPEPSLLVNVALVEDRTFKSDGLRVQSTAKRELQTIRDDYVSLLSVLRQFFGESPRAALVDLAKNWSPRPLNLVVVPQAMLDDPDRWPGYPTSPDSTYPSRYVPNKRTLFVNDTPGFITRDLPFGVALHVLSTVPSLSDADCVRIAEKFEGYYNSKHPR